MYGNNNSFLGGQSGDKGSDNNENDGEGNTGGNYLNPNDQAVGNQAIYDASVAKDQDDSEEMRV